jgi:hypothetical protein
MKEIEKEYRVRGEWLNRHLRRFMGCTQSVGRYKRGDGMFRFVSAKNNEDGTWQVNVAVIPGNHRAVVMNSRRSFEMYPRRDIRKAIKMLVVENKRAASFA